MKKKETEFDTGRSEKMSDVQLSKKLGSYQKQARTWLCVGLVGVLGGLIAYFAVQDTALKVILVTVLFGGGICCAIFVSGDAQKKLKALMQEQMGDFFASELRVRLRISMREATAARIFLRPTCGWTMSISEACRMRDLKPVRRWSSRELSCAAKRVFRRRRQSTSTQGRISVRGES